MKITLTFLALLVSAVLFAQNNQSAKQSTATATSLVAPDKKNGDKKVRCVDKRSRVIQSNSRDNSAAPKKTVRRADYKNSKQSLSK